MTVQDNRIVSDDKIGYRLSGSHVSLICSATNKIIFPTEADARFELKRIRNFKQKNNWKPVRAYGCKACSGWHLTSQAHNKFKDEE